MSNQFAEKAYEDMYKALKVILLTEHIGNYLLDRDPKAYDQVREAIRSADFGRGWTTKENLKPQDPSNHCHKCGEEFEEGQIIFTASDRQDYCPGCAPD